MPNLHRINSYGRYIVSIIGITGIFVNQLKIEADPREIQTSEITNNTYNLIFNYRSTIITAVFNIPIERVPSCVHKKKKKKKETAINGKSSIINNYHYSQLHFLSNIFNRWIREYFISQKSLKRSRKNVRPLFVDWNLVRLIPL